MRPRGIARKIKKARARVMERITGYRNSGGKYARGLSSEGYDAGYLAALDDVDLELRGVPACRRPDFWTDEG